MSLPHSAARARSTESEWTWRSAIVTPKRRLTRAIVDAIGASPTESGCGRVGDFADEVAEPVDIGVVEWCVDLVQYADRRGIGQESREQESERGQRLLAARGPRTAASCRRARHDFEPGGERVVIVDQAQLRLAAAEQLCEQLGEMAVELLEGRSQPLAHFAVERADLTEAIGRLRQGITALDREVRQRLTAAFEQLDRHFAELFTKLFGGGKAQLRLVDNDDPLAAGLEIMASPPGKKLQSLSLLSGGEQALTALALLFAAFLTNPAPVCVLDEVDAPLDDANVDRFCNLVGEIADTTGTRFLLVTHHRITMARVDRLFGVTMAERGVSQLVSVDLARAARMRQTA